MSLFRRILRKAYICPKDYYCTFCNFGFVDVLWGLLDIRNVDVYVTGNNSKMLSTDVMTKFKDRGDEIHVNPLMYKEFYATYQGNKNNAWEEFVT